MFLHFTAAERSGRAVYDGRSLYERMRVRISCRWYGCLPVVSVHFQVEVSATGRSLAQRSPTDCCVLSRNLTNEATLARVGLLRQRKTKITI
jgi:hypothetical protein